MKSEPQLLKKLKLLFDGKICGAVGTILFLSVEEDLGKSQCSIATSKGRNGFNLVGQ